MNGLTFHYSCLKFQHCHRHGPRPTNTILDKSKTLPQLKCVKKKNLDPFHFIFRYYFHFFVASPCHTQIWAHSGSHVHTLSVSYFAFIFLYLRLLIWVVLSTHIVLLSTHFSQISIVWLNKLKNIKWQKLTEMYET